MGGHPSHPVSSKRRPVCDGAPMGGSRLTDCVHASNIACLSAARRAPRAVLGNGRPAHNLNNCARPAISNERHRLDR